MSQENTLRERRPASKSASTSPGLTLSSEPESGEPPQPAQEGVRSSSQPAAAYPYHPALYGWVTKVIWPISCWLACCFFAIAVVYTCADVWKLRMLQLTSEITYAGISVVFGLVLYGIIERIYQICKTKYCLRYDKKLVMMLKIMIDTAVHVFVMGEITKFPSSDHAMWRDVALSWGTGITIITSILLGRLTVEDPGTGFVVLTSAVQPLAFFLMNGNRWVPVYCLGGAYVVVIVVVFRSIL